LSGSAQPGHGHLFGRELAVDGERHVDAQVLAADASIDR
jgi:hypothetical protein